MSAFTMSQATNVNTNNRRGGAPPALDPSRPALVQPYRDFVQMGWISEITLKITPTGFSVVCVPNKTKFPELGNEVSVGIVRDAIVKAGLWQPKKAGQKGTGNNKNNDSLPKKSICKKDFEGNDASLAARVLSVAKGLGDNTGRGRVGSKSLGIEGADTFKKWWVAAKPEHCVQVLTDKKHLEDLTEDDFQRLKRVVPESPFRGPVPTPKEDEAEEEEEVVKKGKKTIRA